jgi:hypothetical protein
MSARTYLALLAIAVVAAFGLAAAIVAQNPEGFGG